MIVEVEYDRVQFVHPEYVKSQGHYEDVEIE